MAEGMHFIIPWFEWPYIYDVRTKPRNVQVRRRVREKRYVGECDWLYARTLLFLFGVL